MKPYKPVDVRPYAEQYRGVWREWMGTQLRKAKYHSSASCCPGTIYEGDVIMPWPHPSRAWGHVECVMRMYGERARGAP